MQRLQPLGAARVAKPRAGRWHALRQLPPSQRALAGLRPGRVRAAGALAEAAVVSALVTSTGANVGQAEVLILPTGKMMDAFTSRPLCESSNVPPSREAYRVFVVWGIEI